MLPPAAMEVAIELLWEEKLAHPQWPHVFVVPRFMTHMWRRDLGKNADILFTVPAGVPFWGGNQFEPLIVAIIFPLAHVSSYTGPWAVKGTDMGTYYKHALGEGFKRPQKGSGPRKAHPGDNGPRGTRGASSSPNYMSWTGHCRECSTIRRRGHGLFCGNFLLPRGDYPPCRSVWCGKCYRESPNDNFPRLDHLQSGSDLEVDATYTQNRY